jgi:hypothetical protein
MAGSGGGVIVGVDPGTYGAIAALDGGAVVRAIDRAAGESVIACGPTTCDQHARRPPFS